MDLLQKLFSLVLGRIDSNVGTRRDQSYRGSGENSRMSQGFDPSEMLELSTSDTIYTIRKATDTFEYRFPTRFNTVSWGWVYIAIIVIGGMILGYGHNVLLRIVTVIVGLAIMITIATARSRAVFAFHAAYPHLNWDEIGDLDERRSTQLSSSARVAVNYIMTHMPVENWLPWIAAKAIGEDVLEESLIKMTHKELYDQAFMRTSQLKDSLQELLDQSKKNTKTRTRKGQDGKEYEEHYKIIVLFLFTEGIHYNLHGNEVSVDELIALMRGERGQDLFSRASLPWLTWELAVGPGSIITKYNREAAFETLTGQSLVSTESTNESNDETVPEVTIPDVLYPGGPPTDLLEKPNSHVQGAPNEGKGVAATLQKMLNEHKLKAQVSVVGVGPTVVVLRIKPEKGFDGTKITAKSETLRAGAEGQLSGLRIYSNDQGFFAEINRKKPATVRFRELISALDKAEGELPIVFGYDAVGNPYIVDLTKLPHLLVAGVTMSGKSVVAHDIIFSLLYKQPFGSVELFLIDPKKVEFSSYKALPGAHFITDLDGSLNTLQSMIDETYRRNGLFEQEGIKNIKNWNKKHPDKKLNYQVVYIEEFAELLNQAEREDPELRKQVMTKSESIAQLSRAAGIHLIISTQYPTSDVLGKNLKANIASRIGLTVGKQVESIVIIDEPGCESLTMKGDSLIKVVGQKDMTRVQTAFIEEDELDRVVQWFVTRQSQDPRSEATDTPDPIDMEEFRMDVMLNNFPDHFIRGVVKHFIINDNEDLSDDEIRAELKQLVIAYRHDGHDDFTLDLDWSVGEVHRGFRLWNAVHTHPNDVKTTAAPFDDDDVIPSLEELFRATEERRKLTEEPMPKRTSQEIYNLLVKNLSEYERILFTKCLASRNPEQISKTTVDRIMKYGERIVDEWVGDPRFVDIDPQKSAEKVNRVVRYYVHEAFPDFVPSSNNDVVADQTVVVTEEKSRRFDETVEIELTKSLRSSGFARQDVTEILDIVEQNTTISAIDAAIREYFIDDDEYTKIMKILKETM